ncbi:TetR family transcriptional regulator [Lentzea sp. NBRC 105346]|uniref:TetR/AcrR family transcriptional regulator n=1 Tax=Lentzea sp. NBRC 105346 TaxID=3032205 RepID=UPI0024A1560F|nr:TetR/AcrR family transcriptional regulator [Lentzea sp. NBRC 105346]GLZ30053.1 TetR family transcriptional regulator [Lentzea sp. NBRC 105346]
MTLSPRDRLVETASRLFYAEGIHTVGVDRLVTEAGVTRATFYRHFRTKDDLVAEYLRSQHERVRSGVDSARTGRSGRDALVSVVDFVAEETCGHDFRGCPFINAAAEYPDPAHPVRQVISAHRAWFHDELRKLAADAGHPDPDHAAGVLVLLRDGALAGGELDDPAVVSQTLRRAIRDVTR